MAKSDHHSNHAKSAGTSTVAKEEDGTLQITFTVPFKEIKLAQEETVVEMAQDIEVPGFRKGKAPIDKVREKIPQAALIEHSLSHILPALLAESIEKHKLRLAMYPRYELISAKENEDWQIRALSCEVPEIVLGEYKKTIPGELRAASLKKELTNEEKEQVVIKSLLETIKLKIPKILITEEVDSRLSSLLARIEKLGLTLESYLASVGKTPDSLRSEYEAQARDAIAIDLILTKIAEEESIKVNGKEIEEALKASQSRDTERNRRLIEAILRKRDALKLLGNLT